MNVAPRSSFVWSLSRFQTRKFKALTNLRPISIGFRPLWVHACGRLFLSRRILQHYQPLLFYSLSILLFLSVSFACLEVCFVVLVIVLSLFMFACLYVSLCFYQYRLIFIIFVSLFSFFIHFTINYSL